MIIIACLIMIGIGLLAAQIDGCWCDVSGVKNVRKYDNWCR